MSGAELTQNPELLVSYLLYRTEEVIMPLTRKIDKIQEMAEKQGSSHSRFQGRGISDRMPA